MFNDAWPPNAIVGKCKPNKPMPITLEGVALQLYEYPTTSPSLTRRQRVCRVRPDRVPFAVVTKMVVPSNNAGEAAPKIMS